MPVGCGGGVSACRRSRRDYAVVQLEAASATGHGNKRRLDHVGNGNGRPDQITQEVHDPADTCLVTFTSELVWKADGPILGRSEAEETQAEA